MAQVCCLQVAVKILAYTTSLLSSFASASGSSGYTGAACGRMFFTGSLRKPGHLQWEDIFAEAKELSQCLKVDLDSITLCEPNLLSVIKVLSILISINIGHEIYLEVELEWTSNAAWSGNLHNVHYHWKPQSSNPHESNGFMIEEKAPDAGPSQEPVKFQVQRRTAEL